MLIAVASKDGREINQHFGHAERFLIYEVEGNDAKLVDEKKVERYCSYDVDHPLRSHILEAIAGALAGCRAMVCAQIGQAPQMEMERLGIDAFIADGPIKPTLIEIAKAL
ncbi:dinitrogenase iron-molybdenum cofactor biosynthesis protein [Geobacter hydrogenophilus]|uniref:Dinitrogenase iron-molybdenum cofactor biosynthesis protein n=1 Tax=Geobacter hydrogenophilus TaxID=40983 RepID=A0A9W6G1B8_9BACT|nr:NifB/NifX family molybdenum-iron cluster-binding protein [Geobacter hydrogenophilus]MBT0892820.1 dinitrogenase iron-molybdenum cofactor biosynthesis protein [Geobacter hydrogenophilus]GLI38706.1 dinitrogenase iron-molybdenum cofactor biosynthesis protein [Geobacter hydrogenophilus]